MATRFNLLDATSMSAVNMQATSVQSNSVTLVPQTIATRPTAPTRGTMGFNTTFSCLEIFDGTLWQQMGISPQAVVRLQVTGSNINLVQSANQPLVRAWSANADFVAEYNRDGLVVPTSGSPPGQFIGGALTILKGLGTDVADITVSGSITILNNTAAVKDFAMVVDFGTVNDADGTFGGALRGSGKSQRVIAAPNSTVTVPFSTSDRLPQTGSNTQSWALVLNVDAANLQVMISQTSAEWSVTMAS